MVAGVRTEDGLRLADARVLIRSGALLQRSEGQNTAIGVIATNATLTKAQATKVAQMGQDGLARTVYPVHTPWDGDALFALATGTFHGPAEVTLIGALAADMVQESVLRAVRAAKGLPGLPSASDLERGR